jgi:hypothetical protein
MLSSSGECSGLTYILVRRDVGFCLLSLNNELSHVPKKAGYEIFTPDSHKIRILKSSTECSCQSRNCRKRVDFVGECTPRIFNTDKKPSFV